MRAWLRLCLICVLVLSGQTLAAARGQAQVDGQIVICAGAAFTTVWVDRDGQPVEQQHICPDMALWLMAAVAVPKDAAAHPSAQFRKIYPALTAKSLSQPVLSPQARDPPPRRVV